MFKLILSCLFLLLLSKVLLCTNIYNDFQFKYGTLTKDTIWSGNILLIGDILIPNKINLTIKKGTIIVFSLQDYENIGVNSQRPEIINNGNIIFQDKDTIKFINLDDNRISSYLTYNSLNKIDISPKSISTEGLKSRWRSYKLQYLFWPIIYSLGLF